MLHHRHAEAPGDLGEDAGRCLSGIRAGAAQPSNGPHGHQFTRGVTDLLTLMIPPHVLVVAVAGVLGAGGVGQRTGTGVPFDHH